MCTDTASPYVDTETTMDAYVWALISAFGLHAVTIYLIPSRLMPGRQTSTSALASFVQLLELLAYTQDPTYLAIPDRYLSVIP
jgi:hypothetical protein